MTRGMRRVLHAGAIARALQQFEHARPPSSPAFATSHLDAQGSADVKRTTAHRDAEGPGYPSHSQLLRDVLCAGRCRRTWSVLRRRERGTGQAWKGPFLYEAVCIATSHRPSGMARLADVPSQVTDLGALADCRPAVERVAACAPRSHCFEYPTQPLSTQATQEAGLVAKSDKAPVYGSGDCRFKSCRDRQTFLLARVW
jgi:hypothetical protein